MHDLTKTPKKPGIYLLRCNINGKIYVGKAINLYERIIRHKNSQKYKHILRPTLIIKAIKKYKWENFSVEILHDFDVPVDKWTLLALECAFLENYDANNLEIGYNMLKVSSDWTGFHHTPESKLRMSYTMKEKYKNGFINPNKGIFLSTKTKKKISQNHANMKGLNNPRCDHQIYTFKNLKTGERFCGTRFDFGCKFNLIAPQTTCIVQGKMRKKWILA